MSDVGLDPSVLVLDKGLDLVTSKMLAQPGSLLSCKNYEITDTMGLSRISGYEPYDAQVSPSLTSLYWVQFASAPSLAEGDIITNTTVPVRETTIRENIIVDSGGEEILVTADGLDSLAWEDDVVTVVTLLNPTLERVIMVGKVVALDTPNNAAWIMVVNSDYFSTTGVLQKLNLTTAVPANLPATLDIQSFDEYYSTAAEVSDALLAASAELRADITNLTTPASGLHLFRDTLYAVATARAFKVRTTASDNPFTLVAAAGDMFTNTLNSGTAYILAISDAVEDEDGVMYYYLQVSESTGWDAAIAAGAQLVGISASGGASANLVAVSAAPASADAFGGILYKCEDVQTQLDNGTAPIVLGWQPIHTGFTIGFTNGPTLATTAPRREWPSNSDAVASRYWLSDGITVLQVELVSVYDTGSATGTMTFRDVRLDSGLPAVPDNTWTMYNNALCNPVDAVALLTDTFTHNQLELAPELAQENTRYEFLTSNFFAQDGYDAFYGVNGVGRAFYYNGDFFAHIYTQASADLDKPRHIENHMMHLALGFKEGSLQLSVLGEPTNFSGDDGASEFGVGDRITGLMTLNGTTLGVFCEKSIWSISGSTVDNFTQGVLIPKVGCLEYSLVNAGTPLYCNGAGIMTLSQSEKYGDFVGVPLSYDVNTWLRPRLRRVTAASSSAPALIGAMPVRSKNQYRLYFKDGAVLTMTITQDGPKFTMQEYTYHLDTSEIITPFAWSSEIDSNNEERINFSYFDTKDGDGSGYIYELDKGWGFAGIPIDHYFETNWFAGASPVTYIGVHKVRLQGTSRGKASLHIAASGDQYDAEYHESEEYLDLPRTPVVFTELAKPVTNIASLANRGLSVQIKISNRVLSQPEPFHTCQVLVLQTKQGGKLDA